VGHGYVITAAETIAVILAGARRNVGMSELFAIIDVWPAVVVEVASCAFDAIVESLPLDVAELLGRRVPATRSLSITRRRRRPLRRPVLRQ
jgi:hypothetical protein